MSVRRTIVLSVALGVILYLAFSIYAGASRMREALVGFHWATMAAGLALAGVNYVLRFAKWEIYLRRLGLRVPFGESLTIFLAGFSLTVTPGKVGEVLKSYLLRERHGIPIARTAPTVIVDRVTDLIALVALSLIGLEALGAGQRVVWIAAALVALFVVVGSSRRLMSGVIGLVGRAPVVGRFEAKLRELYGATADLLHPVPLISTTLISIAAWFAECLAFWLIVRGFPGVEASLDSCTFIYATMTIAGALAFLPGGLGVQEAGMVALLIKLTHGLSEPAAFAATFATRLCTLWFAVLVGVLALLKVGAPRTLPSQGPPPPA